MNDNSETLRNGLMELIKMQFKKLITCHKLISNLVMCDFFNSKNKQKNMQRFNLEVWKVFLFCKQNISFFVND